MEFIKAHLISGAIGIACLALVPFLRRKWRALLSDFMAKAYDYIFKEWPAAFDYARIPPERQAEAKECVRLIVLNAVKLEEILVPDDGMGAEKKKRVMLKLESYGLNEKIVEGLADIIDDSVRVMNEQAEAAVKKYENKL